MEGKAVIYRNNPAILALKLLRDYPASISYQEWESIEERAQECLSIRNIQYEDAHRPHHEAIQLLKEVCAEIAKDYTVTYRAYAEDVLGYDSQPADILYEVTIATKRVGEDPTKMALEFGKWLSEKTFCTDGGKLYGVRVGDGEGVNDLKFMRSIEEVFDYWQIKHNKWNC